MHRGKEKLVKVGMSELQEIFFSLAMKKWVNWNLTKVKHQLINARWGVVISIASWWIWKWWNEKVLNNSLIPISVKIKYLEDMFLVSVAA